MRVSPLSAAVLLGLAVTFALPAPADAVGARKRERLDRGYVTAESRYGGGTVTAPVRPNGPNGRPQIQLPGGTWIDCQYSCSDTLRRETVDFWQSRQWPSGSDGPGYFRFRF
jgi:hypothetical protein